jgi:hypothetical protein
MRRQFHPDHPYVLPPQLVQAAAVARDELRKQIEYVEGKYLAERDITLLTLETESGAITLKASDLMEFLSLNRRRALDSAVGSSKAPDVNRLVTKAGKTVLEFVTIYFDELRKLICKDRKVSLSAAIEGTLASIAVWLTSQLGVASHEAIAVAIGILIALLTATKGAFCRMTEEEAKARLAAARRTKLKKK